MKTYYIIVALICFGFTIISYPIYRHFFPKEVVEESQFSEDCVFYRKVSGSDMIINEPTAGTFRYEVYATTDGVEVWKCN